MVWRKSLAGKEILKVLHSDPPPPPEPRTAVTSYAGVEPPLGNPQLAQAGEALVGENKVRIGPARALDDLFGLDVAALLEFLPCSLEPVAGPSKGCDSVRRVQARGMGSDLVF